MKNNQKKQIQELAKFVHDATYSHIEKCKQYIDDYDLRLSKYDMQHVKPEQFTLNYSNQNKKLGIKVLTAGSFTGKRNYIYITLILNDNEIPFDSIKIEAPKCDEKNNYKLIPAEVEKYSTSIMNVFVDRISNIYNVRKTC